MTAMGYSQQLDYIANILAEMGGVAETQLDHALRAMARRDATAALAAVQLDQKLDQAERQIDSHTVRLLGSAAAPGGRELRALVTAMRLASDLTRFGDLSLGIGKRAMALAQLPAIRPAQQINRLGRMVQEQLKAVLDAYARDDSEMLERASAQRDDIKALYTSLFRDILTLMMDDPGAIAPATHLLFVAKHLERQGALLMQMAEMVHFYLTGQPPAAPAALS